MASTGLHLACCKQLAEALLSPDLPTPLGCNPQDDHCRHHSPSCPVCVCQTLAAICKSSRCTMKRFLRCRPSLGDGVMPLTASNKGGLVQADSEAWRLDHISIDLPDQPLRSLATVSFSQLPTLQKAENLPPCQALLFGGFQIDCCGSFQSVEHPACQSAGVIMLLVWICAGFAHCSAPYFICELAVSRRRTQQ